MAKRRPVATPGQEHDSSVVDDVPLNDRPQVFDPLSIASGLLAGAVVYLAYYPSDSVAVERGDALWFAFLALVVATITWTVRAWRGGGVSGADDRGFFSLRLADVVLDVVPWTLAAWIMLAAFLSCPPGNLRMATNEAWVWVAAAAIFTSARALMADSSVRRSTLVLIALCTMGMAVHGFHQYFVSLPANRAEYRRDPEEILELAGIDAPPDSAERMVFENRLFDGGPTATFALANSLAGVLLIGVVIAVGVLRFGWRDFGMLHRVGWLTLALLCSSCLLAARSRSATLAMLIGVALVLAIASRRSRAWLWGFGGVSLVGAAITALMAAFGNREWFEQAPASLAFRFQYWRSTWRMLLDRPLFGAGPGNFQSIYERYREPSANEQIAEPHNLFFETLASGGFVGLGILIVAVIAAVAWCRRSVDSDQDPGSIQSAESESLPGDRARWVWLGACLSLGLIWLLGMASGRAPDLQASLFVLPVALAGAYALSSSLANVDDRQIDCIVMVVLAAISVHLMVAGGWTVPGVAVPLWLCAAMLTARREHADVDAARRSPIRAVIAVSVGMAMLWMLHLFSLRPVETRTRLMTTAAMAQSAGRIAKARSAIEEAVEADPWSPEPTLWLADLYRWQLVLQGDSTETRRRWENALAATWRRAGDDPASYRMIGVQQLHLYQRHGNENDLAAAAETFAAATRWSPSNQWMAAQMALIAAARGDQAESDRLARQAWTLSRLGGNIERDLSRQQVYPAAPLGRRAEQQPVRRPAAELLPEP